MEYRILGRTGLKISQMGLGGIPIQRIDREGTRTLLHSLMEAGINYTYDLQDWAKARYAATLVKASACVGCGQCETRCPYNLPIRQMLKKVAEKFGE